MAAPCRWACPCGPSVEHAAEKSTSRVADCSSSQVAYLLAVHAKVACIVSTTETIDHQTLARLVEAQAVRATYAVGQPGGWSIVIKYGRAERPLAATRSREVRVFRKFETLVSYLRDIGISRFDTDASKFDPQGGTRRRTRPDTSAALKRAHAAAEHDQWFQAQVEEALREADNPSTPWVSHEDATASWAEKRAQLVELAERGRA